MTPTLLAILFSGLLGMLVIFQVALAFGAPLARFAWGGQHERVLPRRLRIASVVSIVIYGLIASVALDRAGVLTLFPATFSRIAMWVVFGYLALGVLMNLVSRSKAERFTMTPVAAVLALLALGIALSNGSV